jgi:type I restriction enzyme M protein
MVNVIDPRPNERIGDPACGTAGFLMQTREYLKVKYTSEKGKYLHEDGHTSYSEDLLEEYREHVQKELLHGFDFDITMLRIAAMNLMLHGIDSPGIIYQDTLSQSFAEKQSALYENYFDAILANPPFKGSLDFEDVAEDLLSKVKTKKTELLFIVLMLRMMKLGGRCATIVPDGVLFGSSNAHIDLRKLLVEKNQLEGIIKLPAGVFKPYAGVSTAILIFTKGGETNKVWFYDLENDGFSLDDKRQAIEGSDIPNCIEEWNNKFENDNTDKTQKHFFVGKDDIIGNNYDLSINRYKKIVHKEEKHEHHSVIMGKIKILENDIIKGWDEVDKKTRNSLL